MEPIVPPPPPRDSPPPPPPPAPFGAPTPSVPQYTSSPRTAPSTSPQPPNAGWNPGQQPAFYRPPTRPGLAVAALVCGIVGIPSFVLGVLPVLGLIFGLISARQIKRSNGALTGLGMARAGWILGAIGVALFSLFLWAGLTGRLDDDDSNSVFDFGPTEPTVGACLESLPEGELVITYDVIPCDQPHLGEVYLIAGLADSPDENFPGDEEVVLRAETLCIDAFEGFVGVPFDESVFGLYYFYPRSASWGFDDDAICVVTSSTADVTGTLEGVGR